jgi:formiminotetrahydrofolate cyclodeaminase
MSSAERPLADRPLRELLDSVAARTPAPGGGTAAALAGAFAAGLVEMAAKFTVAPGDDADRGARIGEAIERVRRLRERLTELAEHDLEAYGPVLEAQRLPRDEPDRAGRVREALSVAADSPAAIARATAEIAELGAELSRGGNEHLVGDAITGALLAEAACRAATGLVEINLAREPQDPRLPEVAAVARRAAAARAKALARLSG